MHNDVRIPAGSERRRAVARKTTFALCGLAAIGFAAYAASKAPVFFGFDDELRSQFIEVRFEPKGSRAQPIKGEPARAKGVDFRALMDPTVAAPYEGMEAYVRSAKVMRRTGDYVFTIGFEDPKEQMFVVAIPPKTEEGKELFERATRPGSTVSVGGEFKRTPKLTEAKELFKIGDFQAEDATRPASHYIAAATVKPSD